MKVAPRRLTVLGVVLAVIFAAAYIYIRATHSDSSASSSQSGPPAAAPIPAKQALTMLNALKVADRAPKTGYSRDQFGPAWSDDVSVAGGHNNCDTRNDILTRDMVDLSYKDTKKCMVDAGTLHDVYTGRTIKFERGTRTSTDVQIDHIVALSNAWQTGAQKLSEDRRRDLANDPINLQAVDGPTNQAKSDSDANDWLPPNKGYRCAYVTRQIQVKTTYSLWVTKDEKDAMTRELTSCP
ncbi:HNH endonuclease [Nocardia panacis]|uniref:HNH endonuclease n=1 Tax=Nocardia panacis TaxID=2340916 RepID=A0A3A4KF68_9NOCA|nr:HNH endonuclease family protein [Nocardia panacis]RJO79388.1 HNH endonuclease [Nocardia panacis]